MEEDRKIIFLVDDSATMLTAGKEILKGAHKVYPILSAEIMFDLMENVTPNLILLDVDMPEMDGFEAIRRLKSEPRWKDIPVVFLTSRSDEANEFKGLALGAIDFIAKPFSAPLLIRRIENHLASEERRLGQLRMNGNLEKLVDERTWQITSLQNTLLSTIADLVEFRDGMTGGHISRTQEYLRVMIDELKTSKNYADEIREWKIEQVIMSAPLHDVGKIAISDAILNKHDKLTPEEFEIMKGHVTAGARIIRRIEEGTENSAFLRHAYLIAATHHEKWDGSGYPAGLKGTDIPLEGRLMAIADVYDALVSARPYKRPLSAEKAKQIILDGSGTHFDPTLVEVFQRVSDRIAQISRSFSN
ncbi:MAG: response regulator [Candidatus Accumulibacter sp.]|jgi:putative two-component system response regulator|nr:response regulator [Accumulibacter sp.]